jgi:hypothetical protein
MMDCNLRLCVTISASLHHPCPSLNELLRTDVTLFSQESVAPWSLAVAAGNCKDVVPGYLGLRAALYTSLSPISARQSLCEYEHRSRQAGGRHMGGCSGTRGLLGVCLLSSAIAVHKMQCAPDPYSSWNYVCKIAWLWKLDFRVAHQQSTHPTSDFKTCSFLLHPNATEASTNYKCKRLSTWSCYWLCCWYGPARQT